MNSPKSKDRILAEIKTRKPHYEIEGLYEILPGLEAEGYVEVWWDEQHKPIRVKLSDKGKHFVANGGYEKQRKTKVMASVRKAVKWLLVTLVGAVLIELATQAMRHWLSQ